MSKLSQLKQEHASQVEKAPWLAWALPVIACLVLAYAMIGLKQFIAGHETELQRYNSRLAQLQSLSSDTEWSDRAADVTETLREWKSQVTVMQSKTLLQAEILTSIQSIAREVSIEQLDVIVGEPVSDTLNPQYLYFDVNIRLRNSNGFVFEEFWSRLLSEQPFLTVTMLDVIHRRNTLQGQISAQILVIDESD